MQRYGITVPFDGVPLARAARVDRGARGPRLHRRVVGARPNGADAFTPLALAVGVGADAAARHRDRPVVHARPAPRWRSRVASLADAAPGRFALGIGTSSNVIVERWNGIPFEKPYKRMRDMVRFLRAALDRREGQRGVRDVLGQGLPARRRARAEPPILVAALREGMLRLAGREGDGAIINWLSADDVTPGRRRTCTRRRRTRRSWPGSSWCRPRTPTRSRAIGRFAIAAYLNVPVYAAFHEWLGRGDVLQPMWDEWKAGDRKAALEAIPDEVVDELIVHGSPERVPRAPRPLRRQRRHHAGAGDPAVRASTSARPSAISHP